MNTKPSEFIVGVRCDPRSIPEELKPYVDAEKLHVTWFYGGESNYVKFMKISDALEYVIQLGFGFIISGIDTFGKDKDIFVLRVTPDHFEPKIFDDIAAKFGVWRDFQQEEMKGIPYFQKYHITVNVSSLSELQALYSKTKGKILSSWYFFLKEVGGPKMDIPIRNYTIEYKAPDGSWYPVWPESLATRNNDRTEAIKQYNLLKTHEYDTDFLITYLDNGNKNYLQWPYLI